MTSTLGMEGEPQSEGATTKKGSGGQKEDRSDLTIDLKAETTLTELIDQNKKILESRIS